MSAIRGRWASLVRAQQHEAAERRDEGGPAVFGPVSGFEAFLWGRWGAPQHTESIGPVRGGKTPAGAHVYELAPDGRRLTLVKGALSAFRDVTCQTAATGHGPEDYARQP